MSELPPCQIMQQQACHPCGWHSEETFYEDTICILHLVPCSDTRLHQLCSACWCEPVELEADFWSHNSADRREHYEDGGRPS